MATTLTRHMEQPTSMELRLKYAPKRGGSSEKTKVVKDRDKIFALIKRYSSGNTATRPARIEYALKPEEQTAQSDQADYVKELKTAAGGAWSTAEFVEKAHISRQALKERRDSFSIVYWTDAKGHCYYPKWQFDGNLSVRPEVRAVLSKLKTHDTIHVLTKFLVPAFGDKGETVLELLNQGREAEAVAFVQDEQ